MVPLTFRLTDSKNLTSWFHIPSVIQIMWFALILHQMGNCQPSYFYRKNSQLSLFKNQSSSTWNRNAQNKFTFVSRMSPTAALCVLERSGGSMSVEFHFLPVERAHRRWDIPHRDHPGCRHKSVLCEGADCHTLTQHHRDQWWLVQALSFLPGHGYMPG